MAAMSLASLTAMGQTQITDKGYFMSPDGFKCKDGNLYTADFKTLIRAHYAETTIDDPYDICDAYSIQSITEKIPETEDVKAVEYPQPQAVVWLDREDLKMREVKSILKQAGLR